MNYTLFCSLFCPNLAVLIRVKSLYTRVFVAGLSVTEASRFVGGRPRGENAVHEGLD